MYIEQTSKIISLINGKDLFRRSVVEASVYDLPHCFAPLLRAHGGQSIICGTGSYLLHGRAAERGRQKRRKGWEYLHFPLRTRPRGDTPPVAGPRLLKFSLPPNSTTLGTQPLEDNLLSNYSKCDTISLYSLFLVDMWIISVLGLCLKMLLYFYNFF